MENMRRTSSTIPFGYELNESNPEFLNPIPEQLEALETVETMIVNEEVSLQAACDWLEYATDRRISTPGLKKHIDKKYGKRNERLGDQSSSLLAR